MNRTAYVKEDRKQPDKPTEVKVRIEDVDPRSGVVTVGVKANASGPLWQHNITETYMRRMNRGDEFTVVVEDE